jgi:hypothetical protein
MKRFCIAKEDFFNHMANMPTYPKANELKEPYTHIFPSQDKVKGS